MRGFEIRDSISTFGFRGFDLAEVLSLKPVAVGSNWQCRELWATSHDGINVLEPQGASKSNGGLPMSSGELAAFATRMVQAIGTGIHRRTAE